MADITVEGGAQVDGSQIGWYGPYWYGLSIADIYGVTQASGDLVRRRTADGGLTWASTTISSDSIKNLHAVYDQELPGATGHTAHLVYLEDGPNELKYVAVDVAAGTIGTPVTIGSASPGLTGNNNCFVSLAPNGNLIAGSSTFADSQLACWKSVDGGASWSSISSAFWESALQVDICLGMVGGLTSDPADTGAFFWDLSASQISIKMYDDSADTWTETILLSSMVDNRPAGPQWARATQSNGQLLLYAWNAFNTATADLKAVLVNPATIAAVSNTALADVVTNFDNAGLVGVHTHPTTDLISVSIAAGSTDEQTNAVVVIYDSSDGGATYAAQRAYSQGAGAWIDNLYSGVSSRTAGGNHMPLWFVHILEDVYVNVVNSTPESVGPVASAAYAFIA